MKFLLDEGVTISAGHALEAGRHEVIYFARSGLIKGSPDPLVCMSAVASDAVLVAHDRDMKSLAKGHGITPARYRTLSLLHLRCRESAAPRRLKDALSLIEHEWAVGDGRERRLHITIGDGTILTHR